MQITKAFHQHGSAEETFEKRFENRFFKNLEKFFSMNSKNGGAKSDATYRKDFSGNGK